MSTISIELKDELKEQLESKAKALNMNTNDLIVKALSDFFYLDQLDKVRAKLNPKFKDAGYQNEEDIFNEVS